MRKSRSPGSRAIEAETFETLGAPVEVRRHPAARRLTLRVSRTRRAVIVTLPVQCDLDEADNFLNRNIAWVRERLDSLPKPVPFADGVFIPLRGDTHRIVFAGPNRLGTGGQIEQPVSVAAAGGSGFPELVVRGTREHGARRLRDWLIAEAARDLDARVREHAARHGLKPKRIAVRDQASRWGSCSTTGVLSFSWRLIMAPPLVLDYVAAHEVAHLKEMNHGPRFWALVRRMTRETEDAKLWLQMYGMDLHRYGG